MPTYHVLCEGCQTDFEYWQSIKEPFRELHRDAAEDSDCDGTLVRIIDRVRTYAVGERGAETAATDAREKQLSKDRDAYKRFRDKGMQPMQMRGADELEARAANRYEVETRGLVSIPDHEVSRVEEQLAEARDSGWSPVEQVRSEKVKAGKETDVPAGV